MKRQHLIISIILLSFTILYLFSVALVQPVVQPVLAQPPMPPPKTELKQQKNTPQVTFQLVGAFGGSTTTLSQTVTNQHYGVSSTEGAVASGQTAVSTLVLKAVPNLSLYKNGPAQSNIGQPLTYTLTVTNSGYVSATNLLITDTLPVGTNHLTGGVLSGTQVHWRIDSLQPQHSLSVQMVVSPTTSTACTLTNQYYGLSADGDIRIIGQQSITTTISNGQPKHIRVQDPNGQPLSGVSLYHNGLYIGQTSSNAITGTGSLIGGTLTTTAIYCGQNLIALRPIYTQTTHRQAHTQTSQINTAYQVYHTNLAIKNSGTLAPYLVSSHNPTYTLTLSNSHPLILFNVVASIEWDATEQDFESIQVALQNASNYLYDVSDGQMAFGNVAIYDKAQYWADADIQFSTKNTVRPYAFVGGILAQSGLAIRVGRAWDGRSGNRGPWHLSNGYRTLIHEFGHYALHLYDEYFIREVNQFGYIISQFPSACTGLELIYDPEQADNASIMYYQYQASELTDTDRWNLNCRTTEQHRLNGEADWQTLVRYYSSSPLWTLNTPTSRQSVVPGPDLLPADILPFPHTTWHKDGIFSSAHRTLTIQNTNGDPIPNVLVTLYSNRSSYTVPIDQGVTDRNGQIIVYGAVFNDLVRVATFDASAATQLKITELLNYTLTLNPVSRALTANRLSGAVPHLIMTPLSNGEELYLQVNDLPASEQSLNVFLVPATADSPKYTTLSYSAITEAYEGTVSLTGLPIGGGWIQINGFNLPNSSLNSTYNLQQIKTITANALYSEDGNFEFHLPTKTLTLGDEAYATVLPTGYVPGPLPPRTQVIGTAYNVRLSGAVTTLNKNALVKIHYHPDITTVYTNTAIYFWSPTYNEWQKLGGETTQQADKIEVSLITTTTKLGIYALLGQPLSNVIYLPIILK